MPITDEYIRGITEVAGAKGKLLRALIAERPVNYEGASTSVKWSGKSPALTVHCGVT